MQTNSPLGVRERRLTLGNSVWPWVRSCPAFLAIVLVSGWNAVASSQVGDSYFAEPKQASSQLESLLGYDHADVSRNTPVRPTATGHFVAARSPNLAAMPGVNAAEPSLRPFRTAASHMQASQVEASHVQATTNSPVANAWKPQSIADNTPQPTFREPRNATMASTESVAQPPLPVTPVGRMGTEQSSDPLEQPLPGPSQSANRQEPGSARALPGLGQGAKSLLQTGVALAIVLALLFGFVWVFKRTAPKSLLPLPIETVQVLGNAPLHGKQHLRLIRLGRRVLLLAVSETTSQTLADVTDPDEVQYLLELCQRTSSRTEAQTFDAVLREHGRERTTGFLGSQHDQVAHTLGARGTSHDGTRQAVRETEPRPKARPVSNHFFEA
jgi:flagellar biogenesis protein FliO